MFKLFIYVMVTIFYCLEPCNHNCHILTNTSFAPLGLYAATCISMKEARACVGIREEVIFNDLTNQLYNAFAKTDS